MALDLRDCQFFGPALPEPFVRFHLEKHLARVSPLVATAGDEGRDLRHRWDGIRRKLRALGDQGGDIRVLNHVVEPLIAVLGYARVEREKDVSTREGVEDGGWRLVSSDGKASLRAWAVPCGTDLDAPNRRGRAFRFSPSQVAWRVLLAKGERAGLLTDGDELRLLISEPSRRDSFISIRLDRSGGWRAAGSPPDSFRLLLALSSPRGVSALSDLTDQARLAQSAVTRKLRLQARLAVQDFLQEVIDHPTNAAARQGWGDLSLRARDLWSEGLILVYRLLFVFKLESSADPAQAFSFAATSLWRNTFSPNTALAPLARKVLDEGADTGNLLETGLRTLFRLFSEGLACSELKVSPLGGMLFGKDATPQLDGIAWGERAVARLLDALLWTPTGGRAERERVHYGTLDVEDLGRVYEALLELEPGVASEPMCRLRRAKLEVVVPAAQGAPYRSNKLDEAVETEDEEEAEEDESEVKKGKTKVQWIEDIPRGRFYLRVGLGRKATGSYYTPHPFVAFLVQETLGPLLEERSPRTDPKPAEILKLKVLDPAMGSGHFLVEACRYLGDALYEACRLCDEKALEAEAAAVKTKDPAEKARLAAQAADLWQRVADIPDPDDELLAWLPSRVPEGGESGLSLHKARALCRRLVAVHCLYGVDKNRLAVELAKLVLWLESYAEGLPLTFLDHRLVCGDSLTGPMSDRLTTYPRSGEPIDGLFAQGLQGKLKEALNEAMSQVSDLEATVGTDVADVEAKRGARDRLERALAPFKTLAAAWSGGVMLGDEGDDRAYEDLVKGVLGDAGTSIERHISSKPVLARMIEVGMDGIAFDLTFPEVFVERGGFDVVTGNPPWDKSIIEKRSFCSAFSPWILGRDADGQWEEQANDVLSKNELAITLWNTYCFKQRAYGQITSRMAERETKSFTEGHTEHFVLFVERATQVLARKEGGFVAVLTGGGFLSNASAERARRAILTMGSPLLIAQFDNRNKLFPDLPSIIEFCLLIGRSMPAFGSLQYGIRLLSFDVLETRGFETISREDIVAASNQRFIIRSNGAVTSSLSFYQATRTLWKTDLTAEADPAKREYHRWIGEVLCAHGIDGRNMDARDALWHAGYAVFRTGPSVHQYDDFPSQRHSRWETSLAEAIGLSDPRIRSSIQAARHYRFVVRRTCGSPKSNERSMVGAVLPPGYICSDKLMVERSPIDRPTRNALIVCSVWNSYYPDSAARGIISTTFGLTQMSAVPFPGLQSCSFPLLCHSALRLTCNHAGYAPLWQEQVGDAWREPTPPHTWPVLAGDDTRWQVRAAIDAVVADAYGLDRAQYAHVLSSFSHKSYPKAPDLCLAAFDELHALGLDAFVRKHDPYFDIPLNEALPKPVISLPGLEDEPSNPSGVLVSPAPGPLFAHIPSQADSPAPPAHRSSPPPPSAPRPTPESDVLAKLRALLKERGSITSGDAQDATGLDAAGVRPYLQRLVESGTAITEGQRRGTRYLLAPGGPKP